MRHLTLLIGCYFLPLITCSPLNINLANVGQALGDVGSQISKAGKELGDLATASMQNALLNGTTCLPLTVIFARGTLEVGNVGLLTGPPFFSALDSAISTGSVAVQGVDYPANVEGFLAGGSDHGAQTMVSLVNKAICQCPNTKIVMSGYSQGGQVVHKAATLLGETMKSVNSAVIFGDPLNGTAIANMESSKTLIICHADDNICQHGDLILHSHLKYSEDATMAATFVMGQSGLGMDSTRNAVISNANGVRGIAS